MMKYINVILKIFSSFLYLYQLKIPDTILKIGKFIKKIYLLNNNFILFIILIIWI